jgi:hypothetical protein
MGEVPFVLAGLAWAFAGLLFACLPLTDPYRGDPYRRDRYRGHRVRR